MQTGLVRETWGTGYGGVGKGEVVEGEGGGRGLCT